MTGAFAVVIPARHGSTRLPGKPLLDIGGRPMIQHVWNRAMESGADEVVVATDDPRIAEACTGFGASVAMTSSRHQSGTDRIAEVALARDWVEDEIIVNVQGDEPLLPHALVGQVAELLHFNPDAGMATLGTAVQGLDEYLDPNVVKFVARADGTALYFSRAPIPWHRDGAASGLTSQVRWQGAMRHLGLYAYRARHLHEIAAASPCTLEEDERLEQLRALWLGIPIQTDVARALPGPGVDTPEDLERVRQLLSRAGPGGSSP
jgi:3-deoxy-manno-octulosonate cytidylyltransferase (CMP-KDO synthetase)